MKHALQLQALLIVALGQLATPVAAQVPGTQGTRPAVGASLVGSLTDNTNLALAASVAVSGNYAYTVGNGVFAVIDVTQPASPQIVGTVTSATDFPSSDLTWVTVAGNYAYISTNTAQRFTVIDISDPEAPTIAASITNASWSSADVMPIRVVGRYAYMQVGRSIGALAVIDVSVPSNPVLVNTVSLGVAGANAFAGYTLDIQGRYAYLATGTSNATNFLQVWDLISPTAPAKVGSVALPSSFDFPVNVTAFGRYVYVNGDFNTLWGVDVSNPASPALISNTNTGGIRSSAAAGSYLYTTGYYGSATQVGFSVFNIANPAVPSEIVFSPSPFGSTQQTDGLTGLAVQGHYAYTLVEQQSTLLIYDLGGQELSSANVGSLRADALHVRGNAVLRSNATVQGALNVGLAGIASNGPVSAPSLVVPAGAGTGILQPEGAIAVNTTVTGNGADTTEDTLVSVVVPANTLSMVGKCLRVRAQVSYASNADNKTTRLYFGSEVIATPTAATSGGSGWLELVTCKTGPSAQRVTGTGQVGTTPVTPLSTTGAETDTNAITVKLTGQAGTANANDIQSNLILVEALN